MEVYGLLESPHIRQVEPLPATRSQLLKVHSPSYLDALEKANEGEHFPGALKWGLGFGDNPIFSGVYDWNLLVCGGSMLALAEVAEGKCNSAMHTGGGFHHAHYAKAAGFCYLNDLAVAIAQQVEEGKRVLYLDIDAHHGDGVQEAFYDTDRVLTVSIHENPDHLFPGTGYEHELGEGDGTGYSVNVPLAPGASDPTFMEAFDEVQNRGVYKIVFDMADVDFMSSKGWWVLIQTQKSCRRYNRGEVVLASVPQKILDSLDLVGMNHYFQIFQ